MATDPKSIAQQFLTTFYQTFDTNRAGLAPLYAPQAQLTYEEGTYTGQQAIIKKLTELPFQSIQHELTTYDVQLTVDNGLIVFVIGQLKADNDKVFGFSETFYLKEMGGSLFILNDFFRLSLHHQ